MDCEARIRSVIPIEQLILMTPNPQNKPFWKPSLHQEDLDFLMGFKGDDDEWSKKN
jgi:hypothetical protein